MKAMLNKFKEYEEAKRKLSKAIEFGITLDVEISDCFKWYWDEQDREIHWLDSNESKYAEDAYLVKEFNDCYMFKINHCTGDKYYAVFSKENKSDERFD